MGRNATIQSAEVLLPSGELAATLAFFCDQLGFRVESIFPADDPHTAVISGYGVTVQLQRGCCEPPGALRLRCADPDGVAGGARQLRAPNGTRVELVPAAANLELGEHHPTLVIAHAGKPDAWKPGRAGMLYRDLLPGRQGGRFIASHIRIPEGGPVPDYVHYHEVRFQLIFCYRGWVRLVYEDQGDAFVMGEGECVLQPPMIRHRVIECSPGLEVIEVGSPAEHQTHADHAMSLPTTLRRPDRHFAQQRFWLHTRAMDRWQPWRHGGFETCDFGLGAASAGVVGAARVRACPPSSDGDAWRHGQELVLLVVLSGRMHARCAETQANMGPGDAIAIPAGSDYCLSAASADLELLEVVTPAL